MSGTIVGQSMDRGLLKAFEEASAKHRDRRVRASEVKTQIAEKIVDDPGLTFGEINTLSHALDRFPLTAGARRELRGVLEGLKDRSGFVYHREVNVLSQRLALAGAGPGLLSPTLLDQVDFPALYHSAEARAGELMTNPRLQRVDFELGHREPTVLFGFQNDAAQSVLIRLRGDGRHQWQHELGPLGAGFPSVPDPTTLPVSPTQAFHAAFELLPHAEWDVACLGIGDGGAPEYTFWKTSAWRDQPYAIVDATTGQVRVNQAPG